MYDAGKFSIDFDDFEAKAADPHMKLVIWLQSSQPDGPHLDGRGAPARRGHRRKV